MRINRPLLALLVEFLRRPLPPVQVSVRVLMLVVVLVGVSCWLWTTSARLRTAEAFHAWESVRSTMHGIGSAPSPTKITAWHAAMARHYRDSAACIEAIMAAIFLACLSFVVWAGLRRFVHFVRLRRSEGMPSDR
jgi:hypothetical protein